MTLFVGEQNGRYETDHLHMVLNEHIDITVLGVAEGKATITFRTTDGSDLTATYVVTGSTGTGVEDVNSTDVKVRAECGNTCGNHIIFLIISKK